jgi:hypothetical protein
MTFGGLEGQSDRLWRVTSGEQAPATVDRLLRSLPQWFGIDSAIAEYVVKAHELPTYLAWPAAGSAVPDLEPQPVGVLLAVRHFPESAGIHLMLARRTIVWTQLPLRAGVLDTRSPSDRCRGRLARRALAEAAIVGACRSPGCGASARAGAGRRNQPFPPGGWRGADRRPRRIAVTPADTANSAAPDGPATHTGHG